jgi:hypothetical protein
MTTTTSTSSTTIAVAEPVFTTPIRQECTQFHIGLPDVGSQLASVGHRLGMPRTRQSLDSRQLGGKQLGFLAPSSRPPSCATEPAQVDTEPRQQPRPWGAPDPPIWTRTAAWCWASCVAQIGVIWRLRAGVGSPGKLSRAGRRAGNSM